MAAEKYSKRTAADEAQLQEADGTGQARRRE
jgi:hypothetical protein